MRKASAAFLAIFAFSAPACAQESEAYDIERAQLVFDEFALGYPALNATVMVGGEIVWEAEGGTDRRPNDGVETDYNFYSIAKMLTGMAYARLEASEGLDLSQSVRDIDPDLPAHYENVTLRQLLSHTAGVRHYDGDWRAFNDRRCATPADAVGQFIDDPLLSEPGAQFRYSTYGFTLLSHLLVRITGEATFDDAMRSVLGEAYLATTDRDDAEKATILVDFEDGAGIVEFALSSECKFGGGGLIASARDLAAMGAAFAAGDIVDADAMSGILVSEPNEDGDIVGVAYGMTSGYSQSMGAHYAMHSGGSPGGRAFLLVLIEPQVVVATTANFDGERHTELAYDLARIFAGGAGEPAQTE